MVMPPFLTEWVCITYAAIFSFLCGCYPADAHSRAVIVVSPDPLCDEVLRLLDFVSDVLVQPSILCILNGRLRKVIFWAFSARMGSMC